jgi:hypothetical protein
MIGLCYFYRVNEMTSFKKEINQIEKKVVNTYKNIIDKKIKTENYQEEINELDESGKEFDPFNDFKKKLIILGTDNHKDAALYCSHIDYTLPIKSEEDAKTIRRSLKPFNNQIVINAFSKIQKNAQLNKEQQDFLENLILLQRRVQHCEFESLVLRNKVTVKGYRDDVKDNPYYFTNDDKLIKELRASAKTIFRDNSSKAAKVRASLLIATVSLALFVTGTALGFTISPWFFVFSAIGAVGTVAATTGFFASINTTERQLSQLISDVENRGNIAIEEIEALEPINKLK